MSAVVSMSDRIVTAKCPRVRGFAPWSPRERALVLIEQVRAVLEQFDDLLPLSTRQVYYRLVATIGFGKTLNECKRLYETINRAKRSGLLPFEAFRDDGVTKTDPPGFLSKAQIKNTIEWALSSGINKQVWQPVQQLVLCEAAGMVPMLQRIADDYGVPVWSASGFDGSQARYELAKHVAALGEKDKRLIVHHLGDYDPSGVHVYQSLCEDVEAFVLRLGGEVTFRRIAVTPDQIGQHNLPMAPTKDSDAREFDGAGTVQAEALPPDALAEILREALAENFDTQIDTDGAEESARIIRELIAEYGGTSGLSA